MATIGTAEEGAEEETEDPMDATVIIPTISLIIQTGEDITVDPEGISTKTEVIETRMDPLREDKTGNGITTEEIIKNREIGIEIMIPKIIGVGDGKDKITSEVKEMVIGEKDVDGIHNSNSKILITIDHCPWAKNIDTLFHMNIICPTLPNNILLLPDHRLNHAKWSTYANYVKIKVIMTISASLQVTLWPTHNRHSNKTTNTLIKIKVKLTGLLGTMIMKTPTDSLFSKGGSRCH